VLQTGKEQDDSAILLASNRPQHKDKAKKRPTDMKGEQRTNKEVNEVDEYKSLVGAA
jgi:hypothetical protein